MQDESRIAKLLLTSLAGSCAIYCLVALSYVATTPDIGLRCLLAEDDPAVRAAAELTVVDAREEDDRQRKSLRVGDRLIQVAGFRTRTFVDFADAQAWIRSPPKDAVGQLYAGTQPEEALDDSTYVLQQDSSGRRYVDVRFRSLETGHVERAWVVLERQPIGGLALSLVWFVLHTIVFALAGLAYWKRPYDRPLRAYFALCAVTLVAYVGGNHWWVLAGSLWFTIPFTIASILLPAILLHFFLIYPTPKRLMQAWPRRTLLLVYCLPSVFIAGSVVLIAAGAWLTPSGPTSSPATVVELFGGVSVTNFMPMLRTGIYIYLMIAAGYFLLSIIALVDSYLTTRNALERNQVRWILWAGLFAAVPVAYTLALAYFDHVRFAFGSARLPMVLASLAFTSAYAVGIARYKLLLIDQVVNRGMLYYVTSFGLTVLFALLIAAVGVAAWNEATSAYGYALPVIVVLAVAVIALGWLRDRAQRAIDLWFFREKYALDRALQRMNRAVSSLLDRNDVAENMLYTCCEVLRVEDAALYLRDPNGPRFRLVTAVGHTSLPLQFDADDEMLDQIGQGVSLQRVPSGTSPSQLTLRKLNAELIHGLEVDGETAGLVSLGAKPNAAAYTAEDVTFLNAVGRITGVALHCAKVHEDMSRLHQELQRKAEKITEQGRQISVLQGELADSAGLLPNTDKQAEFRRGAIRGHSPAIIQVMDTVRKVAPSDASVLIRGESGTGKELLARALHDNSPRREQPLVSVHCAALAPSLLESELFGHVRGAFTDAREDKLGRFAMADGGTLFLDEIGDISLDVQVKLLRALQERTIEPVGGTKSVQVNVRLVTATHRDLEQRIAEGSFREDLYYRLNVVSVTLPPLRERGDDIFELALFFLRRAAERTGKRITHFDDQAIATLMRHAWPGNIRELENVIERAVVLADGDRITIDDFPTLLHGGPPRTAPAVAVPGRSAILQPRTAALRTRSPSISQATDERELLIDALDRCHGNKAEAARLLNMPRSTYHSKLKKYGLG